MSARTMVVYLVWSRAGRSCDANGTPVPEEDPISYRDWPLVMRDVKAALDHGRQIRITAARLAAATWSKYPAPSEAEVRRLRGA